jgi:molybdopterin-guanine dinucleotide biosynthesis protein A
MERYDQVEAFILCGGASSRMGKPKGLLELGGQPLTVRIARIVEELVSTVTVIGPPEQYAVLGLEVIEDGQFSAKRENDKPPGPLAGIATALRAGSREWNLILACDLPYLSGEWVNWLLSRTTNSDAQIFMPRTTCGLEPLAAAYRRECAEPIAEALRRGIRKVTDAIQQFRTEIVSEPEWRHVDPDGRVLRNMNVREDYEEAQKWLQGRRPQNRPP